MRRRFADVIDRGLVVSCQLDDSEPLHKPQHCALFAQAAMLGGAMGVRAEGLENIKEIRATVRMPIIGCIRGFYDDGSVLVTPDMEAADSLARFGVDVIAVDGTSRPRPDTGATGAEFIAEIRRRHPSQLLLADVSTFDEGLRATEAGADAISTVLFGRTPETYDQGGEPEAHLALVRRLSAVLTQPVFAEGFIWNVSDAGAALEAGAYGVIVGGAITRPRVITRLYADAVERLM